MVRRTVDTGNLLAGPRHRGLRNRDTSNAAGALCFFLCVEAQR